MPSNCQIRCIGPLVLIGAIVAPAGGEEQRVDFARQIRPILTNHCFGCHGPDAKTRQADLRLDRKAEALADRDGHVPFKPGDPRGSEAWRRITSADEDERMPPVDAKKPLSAGQIALIRAWIEQGAEWQDHWAFEPPVSRKPPPVNRPGWTANPIDAFVLARLQREGIQPAPPADRYAIIRRVTLDLTGLPPTIEEVDRFVADNGAEAYEKLVDRLLASPAYCERWARVWLDLARYADSAGYAQDPPRTIWRYRDWVIESLHRNLPFDRFTIEQLAGDLLPGASDDQLLATAFHRNTMTNSEGGTDDEEFRNAAIVDRVNTTMQVWMGLTMQCAQCHSHKYDPISQEEFFRMFAVFNNTQDADRGDEQPTLQTISAEQQQRRAKIQSEIDRLEKSLADLSRGWPEATAVRTQIGELKKKLAAIKGVDTPIMRELPADKRRTTRIQIRGNFRITAKQVSPGVPAAFHPLPDGTKADRLALARWLVDRGNPLTARVTVNRFWEQLFGVGLVETSEDFGLQGAPPSHPKLLDYLAVELMDRGWDVKKLLRRIVTSATYRQSSRVTPQLYQRDPDNRLLARGPRFRLSAEMIRDQALAAGGLLSRKMYGPSVRPPRPNLGLKAAFGGSTDWQTSPGEDRYRRGLYTSWRRTTPYPSMTTFDAPSREVCTIRRIRTNTPLQALVTLNDPVYVEAAQALARRMVAEGGVKLRERATHGFRLCLARPPSQRELDHLIVLYEKALARYRQDADAARKIATEPLGPPPERADVAQLAAWTVVGNVLLNLDEVLAKR